MGVLLTHTDVSRLSAVSAVIVQSNLERVIYNKKKKKAKLNRLVAAFAATNSKSQCYSIQWE